MKNILVIYYSQSGQLFSALEHFLKPFINISNEYSIDYQPIKPLKKFPFPWSKNEFFDVFPESVMEVPQEIEIFPEFILNKNYDLIILGYTIWYLHPSIPIVSFLKNPLTKKLLNNKIIITITACRNMWVNAHLALSKYLLQLDVKWIGNIVLQDKNYNLLSVLTIVHWLFSGYKERYLKIFPLPGVADKDIQNCQVLGNCLLSLWKINQLDMLQSEMNKFAAVEPNLKLIFMEKKASKIFKKWANMIITKPKLRKFGLKLFSFYLPLVIFILSPIMEIIYYLCRPVTFLNDPKRIKYYKSIFIDL